MESKNDPSLVSLGIFFIVTTLGVGGLVKEICKKLPIPFPAAMLMIGIAIGAHMDRVESELVASSMEHLT